MDLEETNAKDYPIWRKLYSARESYSMKALQPVDWHNFAERAATDRKLFDKYFE